MTFFLCGKTARRSETLERAPKKWCQQAKLLKLFEYKLAMFRLTLTAHWSGGEFTNFDADDDMEDE